MGMPPKNKLEIVQHIRLPTLNPKPDSLPFKDPSLNGAFP